MKLVRLGAISLFALTLLALPLTQGVASAKSSKSAKTPEEMSKEALAKWKGTLKITDEQAPQFESVMTESYTKMAEAKTAAAGDKAKMKESMHAIMEDRREALAKVLTPDQMKIYNEKVDKMASQAKKKMEKTEGAAK
jgi:hypothetical protein